MSFAQRFHSFSYLKILASYNEELLFKFLYFFFFFLLKGIIYPKILSLFTAKVTKVMWHVAKYGDPYSEFVLCI